MDEHIYNEYNEKNGLCYELKGDYYLHCLKLLEEEPANIGGWGQRHLRQLKQYHKVRCCNLLITGKLNSYIADIDRQAAEIFERLTKQMAAWGGITEQLKADDPFAWTRKMNNIRN